MNIKDAIKLVSETGTKMSKEKLLETIRKSQAKDFDFLRDSNQSFFLVKIKE